MERGSEVSRETRPTAARSYLDDGTGLAWTLPGDVVGQATFVIDAELVHPVRPALARRFGLVDPVAFAEAWTRAEVWAKLVDVPIATWTRRHGLVEPATVTGLRGVDEIAWETSHFEDAVVTFGVLVPAARAAYGADGS